MLARLTGHYFFTRFDFKVTYLSGPKNVKADAFSRQFPSTKNPEPLTPILPSACFLSPVTWDLKQRLRDCNQNTPPPPECPPEKIIVPSQLRNEVLQWVHTLLGSGHSGVKATSRTHYRWPGWHKGRERYGLSCPLCAQHKTLTGPPSGFWQPHPVPNRP